jgi:hypothetical protein
MKWNVVERSKKPSIRCPDINGVILGRPDPTIIVDMQAVCNARSHKSEETSIDRLALIVEIILVNGVRLRGVGRLILELRLVGDCCVRDREFDHLVALVSRWVQRSRWQI